MCGIAGLYHGDVPADLAMLEAMAARLAHRGPDGRGFELKGSTGLVHTRLSIIDLAGGAQPLYNEDRTLALVANGEIYNHLELRQELEALGHRFATHSDCETILHAYEAWGEHALARLQGMFAFALHDSLRGELWLVRDRLGIKPLYYARSPAGLAFASEPKALLPWFGPPRVDPVGLAQFLQLNFTCAPHTLFQGIFKLPPGHYLRLGSDSEPRLHTWWTPLDVEPADLSPDEMDETLERFDVLMDQVIAIHMRADVPFGLFLSGGVDSSLLAALLARRVTDPLRTWSVGFKDASVHNELDAAARVAQRFRTQHHALLVSANDLLWRLPHAIWAADDLTADYANLPVSLLAERAGSELKVVFSGEGGDEVFAGYGRYRMPAPRRWLAQLRHPGTGGFRTRGLMDRSGRGLAGPALATVLADWRTPLIQAWRDTPESWSRLQRMQYVDLTTWLPDDLLVKADRMLMAWGVEGRVPFLDHRVVEFGLALPDAMKVDARTGKRFLKRWGERHLNREHLWTPKKGFTVPVRDWLRGERLDRLENGLLASAAVRDWLNPAAVRRLCARQRRDGRHSGPLWALLNFALWHRLFIEGDGSPPQRMQDPLSLLEA